MILSGAIQDESTPNGKKWSLLTDSSSSPIMKYLFFFYGRLFGTSTEEGKFFEYIDGDWEEILSIPVYDICRFSDNLVAATSKGIYYSRDQAATWTKTNDDITSISSLFFNKIEYGKHTWVATSSSGIYLSGNEAGASIWEASNMTTKNFTPICFSKELNRWYASNLTLIYTSTDGKTWSPISYSGSSPIAADIYYANGIFVFAEINGGLSYATSSSRIRSNIIDNTFEKVYYADGVWCATGDPGVYYSLDGKTWGKSNLSYGGIDIINYNGIWLTATSGQGIYYSKDGQKWEQSNIKNDIVYNIIYGDECFYATSNTGVYVSRFLN